MFQLQGAIIKASNIRTDPHLVFGVRVGSQLFTLLEYCCIQYFNLAKNEVKMEEWSIL